MYADKIDFCGKSVEVRSDADGDPATRDISPQTTIIDGNQLGAVVCFQGWERAFSVLEGFTLTNGLVSGWYGGGIYCYQASPTIRNNIITGNHAYRGGGMGMEGSSPTIADCIFNGNLADSHGGGIFAFKSSNPTITRCNFTGNSAGEFGGGIFNNFNNATLINCILWNDTPDEIYDSGCTTTLTFSCIQCGYFGTGNIDQDQLFMDPLNGDFHLSSASPCIDAGNNQAPSLPPSDFEGDPRKFSGNGTGLYPVGSPSPVAVVDMGADEYCLLKRKKFIPK